MGLSVILGRLLIGYAVGTITGVAPVFGAEIAKVGFIASSAGIKHVLTRTFADGGAS